MQGSQKNSKQCFVAYQVTNPRAPWSFLTLIVEYQKFRPQKYFISSSQVTSMLCLSTLLVVGTLDGSLNFYDLRESELQHEKTANLYLDFIRAEMLAKDVSEKVVFRFPSFLTEFLQLQGTSELGAEDRALHHQHQSKIVKIIENPNNTSTNEILSLEEFGRIIQWNIIELTNDEANRNYINYGRLSKIGVISPQLIDLAQLISLHTDPLCFDFDIDSENK